MEDRHPSEMQSMMVKKEDGVSIEDVETRFQIQSQSCTSLPLRLRVDVKDRDKLEYLEIEIKYLEINLS